MNSRSNFSITRISIALCAMTLCGGAFSARAENWAQWRGPALNGTSSETSLPSELNPDKNLAWKTELPGSSCATPVIFGDKIFFPALEKGTKKLLAICASKKDGKILWSKEIGIGGETNVKNDMASPSAVTDGKTIWFYYGTGDLAAFDDAGNAIWARNLQKEYGDFHMNWIYSASPLLHGGKLYIPVLHRNVPVGKKGPGAAPVVSDGKSADSYLLCVDPATGKNIFRHIRPTDAQQESQEAYTTPLPIEVNGKTQIVVLGGDFVTGHDPETGDELWRSFDYDNSKSTSYRTVCGPLFAEGLIIGSPPKGGPLFAISPTDGSQKKAPTAWTAGKVTSDVCVPTYYKGNVYVLDGDRKKPLSCLDPKTGNVKWSVEIGGNAVIRTSPTAADDKIYCMNEKAEVVVVSTIDGKILSRQTLPQESPSRSSIVVSDGLVIVRTSTTLFAFKK